MGPIGIGEIIARCDSSDEELDEGPYEAGGQGCKTESEPWRRFVELTARYVTQPVSAWNLPPWPSPQADWVYGQRLVAELTEGVR